MKPKKKFKYGLADFKNAREIDTLTDAFTSLGGERVDSPDWDLLWYFSHEPPPELYKNVSCQRRINHIPGIQVITNKWQLFNNLKHYWESADLFT